MQHWKNKLVESRLASQRETRAELRYRYHERLAILTDGAEPTPDQKAIAEQDAQQWLDARANQS